MENSESDRGVDILSDITIFSKYARYLPELKRRENWDEICNRYENMMIAKFPHLRDEIISALIYVREKKILPSMRALQFAGVPIERNNARGYNCSYSPINHYRAFDEAMFLLLSGCGYGFSVQKHHVEQLPAINPLFKTNGIKERKFLVNDSLEGWAEAVKVLMKSYFGLSQSKPRFDFSDIRAKGARLITSGGKAPGPFPLQMCLFMIESILESKTPGSKLTPIECHDIICHIADAVLTGGIRRAALISLFSFDDEDMISCKSGNWWETNPQRGRANNSVVIVRNKVKEEQFFELWDKIKASNAGEPGVYFTNDKDYGTNPCCEISLRPNTFCNLCEINGDSIVDEDDFYDRCDKAAFLGTLQASFTDFHYLRPIWQINTEKDYLIGVGITGIASNNLTPEMLTIGSNIVKSTNNTWAHEIGIKSAARTTTIKPSGTTSCVLGTSSGIHAWHNDYYIRRMRLGKNESIYTYLLTVNPQLLEDEYFKPNQQAVLSIPIKAPESATLRTESALDLLERVNLFNTDWVQLGYNRGPNHNNVSATISIKDNEWEDVGKWMWDNRSSYNGISVLPYDNGSYIQAPFEDITEEKYNELISAMNAINLDNVIEDNDDTDLSQELACSGGVCSIDDMSQEQINNL
jgi:ribonucleoside-triphosphate reductase